MTRLAKLTLSTALVGTALTVWFVHSQQQDERNAMYQGIVRDEERRKVKREQRERDLQDSLKRRAEYEAVQKVQKIDYDNQ